MSLCKIHKPFGRLGKHFSEFNSFTNRSCKKRTKRLQEADGMGTTAVFLNLFGNEDPLKIYFFPIVDGPPYTQACTHRVLLPIYIQYTE